MEPRRLSAGEWVAAAGAVLLVVALFLPWYSAGSEDLTAWQSMAVDDVLLALIAVGTILAVAATAARRRAAVPVAYMVLAALAGIIALILVVWRLLDPAPAVGVTLEIGAWLGLIGAGAIAVGGWFAIRDEGPARRNEAAARAAAASALERAELLSLPPDLGGTA